MSASAVLAWAVLCAAPASAQSAAARPSLVAGALPVSIAIDGRLDEPAWQLAPAINQLTMVEPTAGNAATFRTVVRVLAGPKAVVIGVQCDDPAPAAIVAFSRARDSYTRDEDHVRLVIDTFLDGRSGYIFSVNANGARSDGLIAPGGDEANTQWDGIWDAGSARSTAGWSVEIWIPLSTLSLKPGATAWAFNLERRVQRLQETDRWASPNVDFELTQVSRAGLVTGLPPVALGLGLTARPSFVAGSGIPTAGAPRRSVRQPSVDVSKRLGANLLSAVTVNTDFAESDVDARRTNFTRFPLFFPEKRSFFLEGSDIFQFGLGTGTDVVPFFSRRVGLVSGTAVPLKAGAKITGRVGATNVGVLAVRTGQVDGVTPASSMAAVRVRRNIWNESSIGAIATVGDPRGRSGSWLAGGDFTYQTSRFRRDKNFLVGAWGVALGRDGVGTGGQTAVGVKIDYPNDRWDLAATYFRVGDRFDPSLGFVPRVGINSYRLNANYQPRPDRFNIRQVFLEQSLQVVTGLGGRWESYRYFIAPVNWRFESGDRIEYNFVPTGEQISVPYEVSDGVSVTPGAYHWRRQRLEVETAAKRRLQGQATWWWGGFYDGTLDQKSIEAAWNPTALLTVELTAEHNIGRVAAGRFVENLAGVRLRLNASSDLQLSGFLQYDTASRDVGVNTRLRWTFRPEGDLFVIYNHNIRDVEARWRLESNQLLVKFQYAFRY